METEFKTAEQVEKWLVEERNVPAKVAAATATILFENNFVYPSALLNLPREHLASLDMISPAHGNLLYNKLQQHYQVSTVDLCDRRGFS